jgi:EPS-associated MarR family transcriptional regulator
MASRRTEDTEDLRFRVLKLVEAQPDLSQRDLAEALGISNGKVNYCLRALIAKGLVKLSNFSNSRHHLGYVYLLTPSGIAEKAALTRRFLQRKVAEYEALKAEIEALRADVGAPGSREGVAEAANGK